MLPIILAAFASDRSGVHLREINEESDVLRAALDPSPRAQLTTLANATPDKIRDAFRAHRGAVRVFHYGGHADGDALHLDSATGARIDGKSFAEFLGQQPGLELVFLNGCATQAQAADLLAAGVPRVIVTDRKINDAAARRFAGEFYRNLAEGRPIGESFAAADPASRLETGDTRDLYWEQQRAPDGPPWHLMPPRRESDWKLPPPPRPWTRYGLVAAVVLLLALAGGGYAWWQAQPFDFTVRLTDESGAPTRLLYTGLALDASDGRLTQQAEGGGLSLRTDPPTEGEVREDGSVLFRKLPGNLRGETVPAELSLAFYETADPSPRFELGPGTATLAIRQDSSLCCLRGTVYDATTDQPVADATVRAGAATATTDASGYFSLQLARPYARRHRIEISHPDYRTYSAFAFPETKSDVSASLRPLR